MESLVADERDRHAAGVSEPETGKAVADRIGPCRGLLVLSLQPQRQAPQSLLSLRGPRVAGAVGANELVFGEITSADPARQPAGQL
jgi:hypothetical protein